MSDLDRHHLYSRLVRETQRTVELLEVAAMWEQAARHRECLALFATLQIRYARPEGQA